MNWFGNLPIRTKLVVIIMAASLSAMLLAGAALIAYDIRLSKDALSQELATLARLLGNRTTAALVFDDPILAQENLQSLKESPSVVMACIYRSDDSLFAEYRTPSQGGTPCPVPTLQGEMDARFDARYLHLQSTIVLDGEKVGDIYLRSELRTINERIRKQLFAGGVFALIGALIAFLLSNRLQRVISIPISDVAATAERIEQERDYGLRAAVDSQDEVGRLAHSFNAMLETIEDQNRQLLDAKDNLEALVASRTRQLKSANRELESFSYSVSHDLRAPLRTIDGFSSALLEHCGDQLDETGQDYLARVRRATGRMAELIDAMLTLSRMTRQDMHVKRVNLSRLVAEVTSELSEANPEQKVDTRIQQGVQATGDPRLLRVALDNLLSNAWKFTRDTIEAQVEFGVEIAGNELVYFVRDNGAGFDMNYYDRLFGTFQRLHDQDDFEGTGIGLATVARIIARHGGRIWAEGEPGKGAIFRFTLDPQLSQNIQPILEDSGDFPVAATGSKSGV